MGVWLGWPFWRDPQSGDPSTKEMGPSPVRHSPNLQCDARNLRRVSKRGQASQTPQHVKHIPRFSACAEPGTRIAPAATNGRLQSRHEAERQGRDRTCRLLTPSSEAGAHHHESGCAIFSSGTFASESLPSHSKHSPQVLSVESLYQ